MNTCITPGCYKTKYPGYNFCGKSCAAKSTHVTNTCSTPGCNKPKHPGYNFCGKSCASGSTQSSSQNIYSGTIDFYNTHDPRTGYLTNLSESRFADTGIPDLHIKGSGMVFPTAEHYYQCMKYALTVVNNKVVMKPFAQWSQHYHALLKLSGRAIQMYDKLANGKPNPIFTTQQCQMWHTIVKQTNVLSYSANRVGNPTSDYINLSVKDWVMLNALRMKFGQNPHLRQKLKQTSGNLYEHTKNDKYWGDNNTHYDGKNMLGVMLMYVRYTI